MLQQNDHVIFRQLFVVSGVKRSKTAVQQVNNHERDSAISKSQSLNFESLQRMTSKQRESGLGLFFISKVRTIMELQNPEFDIDTKLNDIDIDSIAAAELSGIVKSDFNTGISISDILQKFSINDIIKLILNNLNSSSVKPDGKVPEPGVNWLEGEL